jgi:hypothetical protein
MSLATTGTAGPATGSPTSGPVAAPPLVRQRRVRRGFVAAGVLAIVLAALGSATLFRALGPAGEYLAVAADLPAGRQLTAGDLTVVRLTAAPGLPLVPAGESDRVLGRYAAVPLVAGTLLTPGQLTTEPVPGPGEQLVAVPLGADRLPGGSLRAGDPVLLVATGDGAEQPPRTFPARVHDTQPGAGRGTGLVVSVVVATTDGPVVATLAAGDRLAVVRVPEPGR